MSRKSGNAQLVELQNRNIYDVKMIQTLLDAFSKPSFFIGFFSLQPVNVIFTLKSSLGFEESESNDGNQIADHWVSCDNTVIQLKQMTIENVKGGYYEVYLTIRSYLVLELLKQMFSPFSSLSDAQSNHSLLRRHARKPPVLPQRERKQHPQSQLSRGLHQLHPLLLSFLPTLFLPSRLFHKRYLQSIRGSTFVLSTHHRSAKTLRFLQSRQSHRQNHRRRRPRELQSRGYSLFLTDSSPMDWLPGSPRSSPTISSRCNAPFA